MRIVSARKASDAQELDYQPGRGPDFCYPRENNEIRVREMARKIPPIDYVNHML